MTNTYDLNRSLVKHIGEVEQAMSHILDVVDPILWEAAYDAAAEACWLTDYEVYGDPTAGEVWVARRVWLSPEVEAPKADFRLTFGLYVPLFARACDRSWTAAFTGSGPHGLGMALKVEQSIVDPERWKSLLKMHRELFLELRAAGFEFAILEAGRACLPFALDREELARHYEAGTFAQGMEPLADAVSQAIEASALLEELRARALDAARGERELAEPPLVSTF